jgi:hypothetical protein
MPNQKMPVDVAALLSLAPEWALPTERERKEKRAGASMLQLQNYYAQVQPQLAAIAAYLDEFPGGELTGEHLQLLWLAYMALEAALAIEFYKQPELPFGFPRERFVIVDV